MPKGDHRRSGLLLTRLNLAGAAICGVIVAVLLSRQTESSLSTVQLSLFNWFSFSGARSRAMTFGLEAIIAQGLPGQPDRVGLSPDYALWNADSTTKMPISNDVILTTSLLSASGTIFVFAPNLIQALLGLGLISLSAAILIRLTRPTTVHTEGRLTRWLKSLGKFAGLLERIFSNSIWNTVMVRVPNWIAEEAELIENSSASIQLLATVLGIAAITLLTWLKFD